MEATVIDSVEGIRKVLEGAFFKDLLGEDPEVNPVALIARVRDAFPHLVPDWKVLTSEVAKRVAHEAARSALRDLGLTWEEQEAALPEEPDGKGFFISLLSYWNYGEEEIATLLAGGPRAFDQVPGPLGALSDIAEGTDVTRFLRDNGWPQPSKTQLELEASLAAGKLLAFCHEIERLATR